MPDEATVKARVRSAIRYYEMVSGLWSADVLSKKDAPIYSEVAQDLLTDLHVMGCAEAQDLMGFIKYSGQTPAVRPEEYAAVMPSLNDKFRTALWVCADRTTTEARAAWAKLQAK
jgi:hypothetical protein